ncbi:MAG: toxic anion resistance protein, partial [Oscillospiraceae bacterium]|nr:toxic anion resistance protein [Oscillospiraceae bacterium]
VAQTKLTTQLASGSSIKVDTLEETWKTIVDGIEETRKIQEDAKKQREEDSVRLQKLKEDYRAKMSETK